MHTPHTPSAAPTDSNDAFPLCQAIGGLEDCGDCPRRLRCSGTLPPLRASAAVLRERGHL